MNTVRLVSKEHIEYETENREPGIGNREPGTGSLFLIWVNVSDISKLLIGNRESGTGNLELVPCSLFWYVIPKYLKCKSGIRNQFPVPF